MFTVDQKVTDWTIVKQSSNPVASVLPPFRIAAICLKFTSSSATPERPRELGDFKKARVNGGTNNHSLMDSHKWVELSIGFNVPLDTV